MNHVYVLILALLTTFAALAVGVGMARYGAVVLTLFREWRDKRRTRKSGDVERWKEMLDARGEASAPNVHGEPNYWGDVANADDITRWRQIIDERVETKLRAERRARKSDGKKRLAYLAIGLALTSGVAGAVAAFRSAIPFGSAASWSAATQGDPNATEGLWYNSANGVAQARTNGTDWQIDQGAGTGCISPKSAPYNAIGDNVADDTAAVQAAFTAAGVGGRVCFPAGKYRLASVTNVSPLTTPTFLTIEGPGYFLGAGIPAPAQLSFPNVGNGVGIQVGTNVNIRNLFLEGPGTGTGVATTTHIQLAGVQFDNWAVGLALTNTFYARLYSVEFHADAVGISTVGVYDLDIYGGIWRVCPQAINVTDRVAALNLFGGSMEGWSSAGAITTGANSLINVLGVYFESSVSGNAGTAIKNTGTQNTVNLIGNQVYLTEVSKWFDGNGQDLTTLYARANKYIAAVGSTITPTAYTLGINATGGSVDIADEDWTGVLKVGSVFISGGVTAGYLSTVGTTGALTLTPGAASTINTAGGNVNALNFDVPTAGNTLGVGNTRAGPIQIGSSGNTNLITSRSNNFTWLGNAISAGVPTPYNYSVGAYTNITASTEQIDFDYNISTAKTWLTGNFATERDIRIRQPVYQAAAASTITDAVTFDIVNAPNCTSNMTCTNRWALRVEAGGVGLGDATVAQATNVNTNVTVNGASFVITTQSASTAARTAETGFTVTNSALAAASSVICGVSDYSGTAFTNGQPDVSWDTIAAGSMKLHVINRDATNALAGTMKIHCHAL